MTERMTFDSLKAAADAARTSPLLERPGEEAPSQLDGLPTQLQEAGRGDIEKPAQDVVNLARDLYRLVGRIESAARRMRSTRPELALKVLRSISSIDQMARRLSMDVDDAVLEATERGDIPTKIGEVVYHEAHGKKLMVKYHSKNTYFARIEGTKEHARWGNAKQIRDDIDHFKDSGSLPRSGGRW